MDIGIYDSHKDASWLNWIKIIRNGEFISSCVEISIYGINSIGDVGEHETAEAAVEMNEIIN